MARHGPRDADAARRAVRRAHTVTNSRLKVASGPFPDRLPRILGGVRAAALGEDPADDKDDDADDNDDAGANSGD